MSPNDILMPVVLLFKRLIIHSVLNYCVCCVIAACLSVYDS